MAGAKQHEMMFTLAAKQNSSFGAAFSGARGEFQRLYQEAAKLTEQQNDISAYTRQQSAIESTQNSLTRYQEKLDNVREALTRMEQTGEGTTQETLKLQQQEAELAFKVSETSRKLTEQEEKLGTMGSKLEEAGIDTNNLSEAQDRIQGELAETKGKMDEIDSSGSFMDPASDSLAAFGSVAAAVGAGKIFDTIIDGLKEAADAAADFEFAMSAVEAIANSSTEEISALSDKALEIGASTMYTATEAADALSYMALAGWNSQEMLAGVDGVIQLAAASGEDLASVSDIVTDALTAFGLTASDSAGFVDVLAAAAANSNTTVNMLGDAFKYAAPVAGALGYSVEDVAVAMGLMANNGIKGSQAGTTLRNVFNALTGDIALSSSAFGDIEISAVNADGTMMSLSDTIQMLRGYFDQMTEAEQVQNAQALAGTRAYAGLLAILNTTEDDYNSLTDAINNSTGAAERMANTRMDNAIGDLRLLESAYNGLQIAVGNNFTPALSGMYEVGTDVLSWMTEVAEENPALVSGLSASAVAFGGLTAAILAFNSAKQLAQKIGLAELLPAAGTLAAIGGVAAALGLVVVGVQSSLAAYDEMYEASMSLTAAGREQEAEIASLTAQYDALVDAGEGNSAEAQVLQQQISQLSAEFEASKQSVEQFTDSVNEMARSTLESWESFDETMASIDDQEEGTANLITRLEELSTQTSLTAGEQAEMSAIVDILNSRYEDLGLTMEDLTGSTPITMDSIRAVTEAAAEQARFNATVQQYQNAIMEQPALLQAHETAAEELAAAERELEAAEQAQKNAWDSGIDSLGANAEVQAARDKVAELQEALDNATEAVDRNADMLGEAEGALESYAEAQEAAVDGTEAIYQAMADLSEEYAEVYTSALESFQGQFSLFEQAPEIVATSTDEIIANLESQTEYFNTYAENLNTIKERIDALNAQGYDTSGLEAYISAANDGSADAANAFAAIASASDEALVAINDNYNAKAIAEGEAATATAEMETDFTAKMAEMESAIAEMEANANGTLAQLASDFDKSTEAGAAGVSMMTTYNNTLASYSNVLFTTGQNLTTSFVNGMNSVSIPSPTIPGFATGTESAPPGWAWVGENGPELMMMQGGEQILNHHESEMFAQHMEAAEMAAANPPEQTQYTSNQRPMEFDYTPQGTTVEVTVSPHIEITGVGSADEMQAVSADLVEQLREMIADEMERIGADTRRSRL